MTGQNINQPPPKLCSNCAYRANCNKRFSVNTVNGQVRCMEYELDLALCRPVKDGM